MPRRAVVIDLEELEKLAALHCTQEEAAGWFGIARETLSRKLRQKRYREAWDRGKLRGLVSLRRKQFQKNTDAMLIWLGKQYLGQRDRPDGDENSRSAAEEYLRRQKGDPL
jgi:hypothetical protein